MSHHDHDLPARPEMGAYILMEVHQGRADGVLVAQDEESQKVIRSAAGILSVQGYACRLVRMADEARFASQAAEYREAVLPARLPALSPEPGEAPAALARRMLALLQGK